MVLTLPDVPPGPCGATLVTIDERLGVALAVAVAAVAAGILAQVLHAWLLRRSSRDAPGRRLPLLPTRRAA